MPTPLLLPVPQKMTLTEGTFQITAATPMFLPRKSERPEFLAAMRIADAIEKNSGIRPVPARPGVEPVPASNAIVFEYSEDEKDPVKAQGYMLSIKADGIRVAGKSADGLFNGMQSFKQLVDQYGAELPAMEIEDWPEFQFRGFYFDISRGKVPKLQTYKWLVDYLAERKINMLQLYVEHPFEFRFDPSIAHSTDALTPEEVLELVQYCDDRRVDFVPSLASFGHMGGVLSLPQYRHLADVELPKDWDDMTWHERMVGGTINMSDPEALALLEKMHDEFVPLFDSPFVNVCADETYALGEGKNKELAEKEGKHTLYLRHIKWLGELAKKHGCRMMFWGDIVVQQPDCISEIPKDTIPMNWGYWRKFKYETNKYFADAGLDFFVCPGTSSWNRISNGIINADLNIRKMAESGRENGAMGLLNTDWGDHGNYNMLGGSLHGIALGAAMSWNPDEPNPDDFDRIWNVQTFGIDDGRGIASLREQSDDGSDYLTTWVLFYQPLDEQVFFDKMSAAVAEKLIKDGREGARVFSDYLAKDCENAWVAREMSHMSRMNALLGEKYFLAVDLKNARENPGSASKELPMRLRAFADTVDRLFDEYSTYWLEYNKRSDLGRIEERFRALSRQAREVAVELEAPVSK